MRRSWRQQCLHRNRVSGGSRLTLISSISLRLTIFIFVGIIHFLTGTSAQRWQRRLFHFAGTYSSRLLIVTTGSGSPSMSPPAESIASKVLAGFENLCASLLYLVARFPGESSQCRLCLFR